MGSLRDASGVSLTMTNITVPARMLTMLSNVAPISHHHQKERNKAQNLR